MRKKEKPRGGNLDHTVEKEDNVVGTSGFCFHTWLTDKNSKFVCTAWIFCDEDNELRLSEHQIRILHESDAIIGIIRSCFYLLVTMMPSIS